MTLRIKRIISDKTFVIDYFRAYIETLFLGRRFVLIKNETFLYMWTGSEISAFAGKAKLQVVDLNSPSGIT